MALRHAAQTGGGDRLDIIFCPSDVSIMHIIRPSHADSSRVSYSVHCFAVSYPPPLATLTGAVEQVGRDGLRIDTSLHRLLQFWHLLLDVQADRCETNIDTTNIENKTQNDESNVQRHYYHNCGQHQQQQFMT